MSQGYCASVRVHLLEGEAQVLYGKDGLTGERLVDFVEVDIVFREAGLVECLRW